MEVPFLRLRLLPFRTRWVLNVDLPTGPSSFFTLFLRDPLPLLRQSST